MNRAGRGARLGARRPAAAGSSDRLGHTEAAVRQRASRLRAVQFAADVAGAGLPAFVHDEHALVGELGQGAAAQVGAAFAFLKAWHAGKRGVGLHPAVRPERCGPPGEALHEPGHGHRVGLADAVDVGSRSGSSGGCGACVRRRRRAHALSNHQHVVIVMRDVRHVAERLPHALAEGVDRRAERVF